jgi:PAS domain S-box-containing protein
MIAIARSVKSRILIVVAAAVVPQALLAAVLMARYAHNQRGEFQAVTTMIARGFAAAADTELSVMFATGRTLGQSDALRRGDLQAFLEQARAVAERGQNWHVVLMNEAGDVLLNTQRPLGAPLPRVSHEMINEALRTGQPAVTPVVRCPLTGTWMVGVVLPIAQVGSARALLAIMTDARGLGDRLRLERLPPGSMAALIDRTGAIVADIGDGAANGSRIGDHADRLGLPSAADTLLPLGDAAEGQTMTHLPDGTAMLTSFARAPGTGWMVAIRMPEAKVLGPVVHSLWLIAGCGVALSLLAVALALYHARGIGRAVDVLAAAAAALDRGAVPPPITLPLSEVQHAHDRIRVAAARLNQHETERSALLAELEDRVAARTQQLALSEQRFRLLAETATDTILRTDATGAFRYVSPAAEALAMEPPAALLGKRLRDLALITDLPQVVGFEHAVLEGNTTMRCTFRLHPRDGRAVWVEAAGHRIRDDAESPDGAVIALRDISERKAAEERVARSAAEARAADRAKSEFLARMSHELRTPLNAVNGFAEVLLQDPGLQPLHREWVGNIVSGARQLLRLIEDVLDLARIESGRLKVVIGSVDAAALIEETMRMLTPAAQERQVVLAATPVPPGTTVLADRARLLQVLLNLGTNAIKYNRLCGNVRIMVTPQEAGESAPGATPKAAMVRFTVADDGPGIPASRLGDIFQPLQRLGQERGRVEGTGIGLAITRQLVGLMRGVISVDSDAGRGATFHVDLAAADAPAAGAGAPPAVLGWPPESPFDVLYIEDTEAAQQLMRAIFAFVPGARLHVVTTAAEGLRWARQNRPDCVITDVRLRDMDGFDVLAALRADPQTADLPVVAVSGEAMPDAVAKGLSAGFFAYITKPFQLTDLIETLDRLRRQRPARPATPSAEAEAPAGRSPAEVAA